MKLEHLKEVFKENGYQDEHINKAIEKAQRRPTKGELIIPKVTLPYIKGTTDRIAKILKRKNINVAFPPPNTIKGIIDSSKDTVDPKQQKEFMKSLVHVIMSI